MRNKKVVITWSDAVVQQVARSYTQFPDLGFAAFDKCWAYAQAKKQIHERMSSKSTESPEYWCVNYYATVVLEDLLGELRASPLPKTLKLRESAMRMLQEFPGSLPVVKASDPTSGLVPQAMANSFVPACTCAYSVVRNTCIWRYYSNIKLTKSLVLSWAVLCSLVCFAVTVLKLAFGFGV